MKTITRETRAAEARELWDQQYPHAKTDNDKNAIADALAALGPAPSPDAVDRAIGNGSWTRLTCTECREDVNVVVRLGEEPDWDSATVTICLSCLRKAEHSASLAGVPAGPREGAVKSWPYIALLALVITLTGCSAKARIGTAAALATEKAASATVHIDTAIGTGEVGPAALPHLDDAKADIADIGEAAASISDALPGVKDVESPFWRFLKSLGFILSLVGVLLLSVFYAPVIRPALLLIGSWLNLIPKAVKVDAQADAELIANNEAGKVKATVKQIAAIERKKASDPRYAKVLDKGLNSEGVAT